MIRPLPVLATALALVACQPPSPAVETLSLHEGWEFRRGDRAPAPGFPDTLREPLSIWRPANVPGTIHTDLLANQIIPDPFWRDRELVLQWIGEEDWWYRTTLDLPSRMLEKEVLELVFHGIDTFSEVRLNGTPILATDNMFRAWSLDVTGDLRAGENTLEVRLRSPLPPALEARASLPYPLPAGNDRGDPPSRVFVRKAAYHYGWDWGPRFVTSGIWRPVELRAWSGARIEEVHVRTDSLTPGAASLTAFVEVDVSRQEAERRRAGGSVPATLSLSSPDGAFETVEQEITLGEGTQEGRLAFRIQSPRLWWPNGMGEPHLYRVRAVLKAGRRSDTLTTRVGIREVELVTEADSLGESFFFEVNGVPLFVKGANVIPQDHFSPRVTPRQYRELFSDVADANMNMLRVWGGGIYERDLFYDLADEHGVLIWQDFMFANGMYPGDSLFLASVEAEARHQVRRLRSHPSLALWCGNNEIDEAWENWGWARRYDTPEDSAAVWSSYEALFHGVLPEVVAELDPDRSYWPSSPSLGWGDPESLNRGDSHYWGVWHGQEPFRVFNEKLPRFASEFGFQAYPPLETIEAFTAPGDRELGDPVLLVHQKHPIGNEIITAYMDRHYPVPAGFQDFVYLSQLLQARGMRTAFEAHRRSRPRTMGTLYWQLNDTWPAISWSSRDYFGRWKALHYAVREAFAPLLISPILREDTLEIWAVSDLTHPVGGTLFLEILSFDGTSLWQAPIPFQIPGGDSHLVWSRTADALLGGADSRSLVVVAELREGEGTEPATQALFYFHTPEELALEAPAIRFSVEEGEDDSPVLLVLEAGKLAKDVYLSLEGAIFSDNFFDLLPGRPRAVEVRTELTAREIEEDLRIKTLADVPREGLKPEGQLF